MYDGESCTTMWMYLVALEKEMATHSRILAWRIPWTEEPGGLQSMVSQESDTTWWLNHTTTTSWHWTAYLLFSRSVSRVWLCKPMECSTPSFLVLHHLPESAQTHVHWICDAVQPSCPLSSPSPPAFKLSQLNMVKIVYFILSDFYNN